VALFPKLDLIALLVDSYFESGIYNHVLLSSISPRAANTDLVLPRSNSTIFGGDSADYGPKSIWGSE